MLHQTFLFLGQLWQLFEVSQILEFLRYNFSTAGKQRPARLHNLGKRWKISVISSPQNILIREWQTFLSIFPTSLDTNFVFNQYRLPNRNCIMLLDAFILCAHGRDHGRLACTRRGNIVSECACLQLKNS